MNVANVQQQTHFVLVHGGGHGAWCWYKLKPLLESAGQRVKAIDLSAAGINPKSVQELFTLHDHTLPLLEFLGSLPHNDKVVLVGHSYGGMNLALAMETYPQTISVAVFISALMPDTIHPPSYPMEQFFAQSSEDTLLDTKFSHYGSPEKPGESMLCGPLCLSAKLYYQLCSAEDLELAKLLVRPNSIFHDDLSKAKPISAEKYGSVKRAFVVCMEDKIMSLDIQRWFIENIGVAEVKEIKGNHHQSTITGNHHQRHVAPLSFSLLSQQNNNRTLLPFLISPAVSLSPSIGNFLRSKTWMVLTLTEKSGHQVTHPIIFFSFPWLFSEEIYRGCCKSFE